jgi:hypothetical protein
MNRRSSMNRLMAWGLMGLVAVLLSACSVFSNVVDHTFAFDLRRDDQDAELLDYRYGESKLPVSADRRQVARGETFKFEGVTGPMLRGDSLYMKWRNIPTGKIYEDTVELKNRLPHNIENHTIYPMIYGPQLYVFLILPDSIRRGFNDPQIGPRVYRGAGNKIIQIYPDQTQK